MLKIGEVIKMEFGFCVEYRCKYKFGQMVNIDGVFVCLNREIMK